MTQAGWAKPTNAPRYQPVHWWRPDGRKACDPQDSLGYLGPKLDEGVIDPADVCLGCEQVVSQAREVLGLVKVASRSGE